MRDNERRQLKKGQMQKAAALELARRLNPRKRERVTVIHNPAPKQGWALRWERFVNWIRNKAGIK